MKKFLLTTLLVASFAIAHSVPYTLSDDDVVVTNGVIESCSYSFANKEIVIPSTLDGQTVTAISSNNTDFADVGITSITLPTSIRQIGNSVFTGNNFTSVNFTECTGLTHIGEGAFSYGLLESVDLSLCTSLSVIGSGAFYDNQISFFNVSGCTSLTEIGAYSFTDNSLQSVDLSACTALTSIGDQAFNTNSGLNSVNITGCTSLSSIGANAFNTFAAGYHLPQVVINQVTYNSWKDSDGNTYSSGVDKVTDFTMSFSVNIPYTLSDEDVVVENGIIKSCSYNFEQKSIVIPAVLDGQNVTGIEDSYPGVFSDRGIVEVQLPATLTSIGNYAFYENDLSSIDLTNATVLNYIGEGAFSINSLSSLNLSTCAALVKVSDGAFFDNNITTFNVTGCTSLEVIGDHAFGSNNITSINLSSCTALDSIGKYSFNNNTNLSQIAITGCSSLKYIGISAFYQVDGGFDLPVVTYAGKTYTAWKDASNNIYTAGTNKATDFSTTYIPLLPYILKDDDVVVEDGEIKSCSYNFEHTNIIIPETLDGQTVTSIIDGNGTFYSKSLTGVKLPSTIETIGKYAFYGNSLFEIDFSNCANLKELREGAFSYNQITSVDISNCSSLITIGNGAFYSNQIAAFPINSVLETIGDYAFGANKLQSINLSNCDALKTIGEYAFDENETLISINLNGCSNLNYIGPYGFSPVGGGFDLPVVDYAGYDYDLWKDENGDIYIAGSDKATDFEISYTVGSGNCGFEFLIAKQGDVLYADFTADSYQWLDANNDYAPIDGATNNAYLFEGDGSYALQITKDGCTAISNVYNLVVTAEDVFERKSVQSIKAYPNPTNGILNLKGLPEEEIDVFIYNSFGQLIHVKPMSSNQSTLNIETYNRGVYFLRFPTNVDSDIKIVKM